jgi:hypothetical protein
VKPSRGVLTLIATGAVAGLVGLAWYRNREPSYEGKSLSEWLKAYRTPAWSTSHIVSQPAADAVRHIGTNALPFLVSWIQEMRTGFPKWKEPLFSAVFHWKPGTPGRETLLDSMASREIRASCAIWGFEILGETARPAIPDLVRIANEGKTPSSELAIGALSYLGKDALPPLLSMITNTDLQIRRDAFSSLSQMRYLGTNAHPAVVLLIQCLQNPGLAKDAAGTLGRLHLESDIAVSALIECTRSANRGMRVQGVSGLEEFGPEARAAVPQLTKLLSDPEGIVRDATTNALHAIAPEALQQSSVP